MDGAEEHGPISGCPDGLQQLSVAGTGRGQGAASSLGSIVWGGQFLSSPRFIQGKSDQCRRPCSGRE